MKSRHSSTINARRTSADQIDVLSDASSTQLSSKGSMILGSQLDRRASDGTNLTGLTSPLTRSESAGSLERDSTFEAKEEMRVGSSILEEGSEGDDKGSVPSTPCSPATLFEEAGDQTTWERFKRGAVIEPPEAEASASYSASWVNEEVVYPRYTSLTTFRRGSNSPGKDTVKAQGTDTRAPSTKSAVILVPFGNDGRTFRFTTQ